MADTPTDYQVMSVYEKLGLLQELGVMLGSLKVDNLHEQLADLDTGLIIDVLEELNRVQRPSLRSKGISSLGVCS
jgi:hypothetical protein